MVIITIWAFLQLPVIKSLSTISGTIGPNLEN